MAGKAEWLKRFKKQREDAESGMREAGMGAEDIYSWKRRTSTSPEEKGELPMPEKKKGKPSGPAYMKTIEEQEKRRRALDALRQKERRK